MIIWNEFGFHAQEFPSFSQETIASQESDVFQDPPRWTDCLAELPFLLHSRIQCRSSRSSSLGAEWAK